MLQFGGKQNKSSSSYSKRHFTVIMGGKEHGLYVSSTPSSAAKKAVTKLCSSNKSKKVEFYIREITQGSKKKTYGPYSGYIEKLKEPIELKGRVIKYKPVAKLSGKLGVKKGGGPLDDLKLFYNENITKAKDKLKRMTETEQFNQLSLDEKNAILLQWAQEWNKKILQKFIDKNDEYSKRLVKMIQERKITIFIPIKYEGDEHVTIDFLKIDDIISKIVGIQLSNFINSNSNNNNNNTFFVNSSAGPAQNYRNESNFFLDSAAGPAQNHRNEPNRFLDGSATGSEKIKIPELLIINYASKNESTEKAEILKKNPLSMETVKYREKLEDFAIYLKSKGIKLSNNEKIIKNVKFFLEKYYNKPTKDQLETAIKAVRLFIQRKQRARRKTGLNFTNFKWNIN